MTVQPVSATNGVPPSRFSRTHRPRNRLVPTRGGGVRLNLDDLADQLEYESERLRSSPPGCPSWQIGGIFSDRGLTPVNRCIAKVIPTIWKSGRR